MAAFISKEANGAGDGVVIDGIDDLTAAPFLFYQPSSNQGSEMVGEGGEGQASMERDVADDHPVIAGSNK